MKSSHGYRGCQLALALLLTTVAVSAQTQEDDDSSYRADFIRANYAKFEFRVPMRDGALLFTAVFVPNDASTDRTYPFLLTRTPYGVGPYGADRYPERLGPSERYEEAGYIFVRQDVRGRWLSEGEFLNMRPHRPAKTGGEQVDESSDTYDTIEWLLEHVPHNNGRAGLWGLSYGGFYASAGMIDSHPALRAVSPQAPIADWFWDDMHHHGAFALNLAFNFFAVFGQPRPDPTTEPAEHFDHGTPDGYQFFLELGPLSNVEAHYFDGGIPFWTEVAEHPNYDEFWQARNILPHLRNVSAAVLTVGGWFDTEDLYGPLETYRSVERNNPDIFNAIVMGPWRHGGWIRDDGSRLGTAEFGAPTAERYREQIEFPFFEHHLRDGESPGLAEATVFETGANRWRRFDRWPPAGAERAALYLRKGGSLALDPPPPGDGRDSFLSDPAKPVPYTMEITPRWAREYMTEDQRFAARRPDVLVYVTEPLDRDLTLAGPLRADLYVSTTESAADWVVKLIDVFPGRPLDGERRTAGDDPDPRGGQQQLVRWEAIRGRFRNGYEQPEPFEPGEVARVAFDVPDVLHTFQRGHRVMVQIQSSFFPFLDRNPQRYVPNIFAARDEDFVRATHTVHRSRAYPSRLEVGILEAPGLPAPTVFTKRTSE